MTVLYFISLLVFSYVLGAGLAATLAAIAFCRASTEYLIYYIATSAIVGGGLASVIFPFIYYYKLNKVINDGFMVLFLGAVVVSGLICYVCSLFDVGWIGMVSSVLVLVLCFTLFRP